MALIPARLKSTRLFQKPLQKILDKTLIEYVATEALKTDLFDKVYVATDSEQVATLFESGPIKALMTSEKHESGTDRIYEAAQKITEDFDTVINIQGDEPFVYKEDLQKILNTLEEGARFCSLYEALKKEEVEDPNKVKVLLNEKSEAIYFSRFAVPFSREKTQSLNSKFIGKHIGVYAYTKDFLEKFCKAPVGYFESYEKLEQLRALQMGEKVKMIFTENSYLGVDTEEDLKRVNKILGGNRD